MISLGFTLAPRPHTEQENTKFNGPQLTEMANEIYEKIKCVSRLLARKFKIFRSCMIVLHNLSKTKKADWEQESFNF